MKRGPQPPGTLKPRCWSSGFSLLPIATRLPDWPTRMREAALWARKSLLRGFKVCNRRTARPAAFVTLPAAKT